MKWSLRINPRGPTNLGAKKKKKGQDAHPLSLYPSHLDTSAACSFPAYEALSHHSIDRWYIDDETLHLCRRHSWSIPQLRPRLLRPVHIIVSSGPSILRGLDPSATNVIRQHTGTELDLVKKWYLLSLCSINTRVPYCRLVSGSTSRWQMARDHLLVPRIETSRRGRLAYCM